MKQKISAYNIVILGAILIFGQLHFAFAQNKEGSFPPEKNEYIKQIKHHSATPETYRQLADIYIYKKTLWTRPLKLFPRLKTGLAQHPSLCLI